MPFPKQANDYSRGTGCPYCANQKVSPYNNLLVKDPETSKSWHYKKNYPVRPEDVVPGSRTKRWLKFLKSRNHKPWRTTHHNRSQLKEGCKRIYRNVDKKSPFS